MNKCLSVLLLVLIIGGIMPSGLMGQDPKPTDNTVMAKEFVSLLAENDLDSAVKYFDDTMKAALPPEKLRETWGALVAQAGPFKRQVSERKEERGPYQAIIVTCEFEKAMVDVQVVFDPAKKISGLFFSPAGSAAAKPSVPGYVTPSAFREQEVTIGSGEWELPGTLTKPAGKGPFPAVVLVHGSGPHDRDSTLGPNKPLRDLAWGLASNGIAVLRYEKRTKQHASKIVSLKRFTAREETVDDVLAAVALLRKTADIEAEKVFVLGHSLGGTLVPRIGLLDIGHIAGFIVLAGAVKPLEDAILEQTRYIAAADGTVSKEEQARIDEIQQLVSKVKSLGASDIDSPMYIFGAPVSYWLDLRGYDPPAAAKKLKQPMLILQGERDYQVTMEDFQKWKDALSARKRVTFRSYPKLNHLFMEGSGKSTPAEYQKAGNVSEAVIKDIVDWVNSSTQN